MLFLRFPSFDKELDPLFELTFPVEECNNRRAVKRLFDNQSLTSAVKKQKSDGFNVKLDVTHFKPEDITIKVVDNDLIVIGKHEERLDGNESYVSRQFTRRYHLPENIDLERISSKLSKAGKLEIDAPLKRESEPTERVIPINFEKQKLSEEKENSIEKTTEEVVGA